MMMMMGGAEAKLRDKAETSSPPILVMGDWGGKPTWPYTTSEEVKTAKGMADFAKQNGVNITLALGDNFYDSGVKSVRFRQLFQSKLDIQSHRFFFFLILSSGGR